MVDLPRPNPSEEGQPFFDYLKDGELRIQQCSSCAKFRQPPQPMCSACGSFASDWVKVSGSGTVYSYVVTHQAIHPALVDRVPFLTVSIALDEGPHMTSNLVDVGPEEVQIGMPVQLEIVDKGDGLVLPMFRRA